MVMAVFAYIYLQSFIVSQSVSVDKILDQVNELLDFVSKLKNIHFCTESLNQTCDGFIVDIDEPYL